MNDIDLQNIQDILGYNFRNVALLKQAFVRSSFAHENKGTTCNEILEFVGDSALSLCVVNMICSRATVTDVGVRFGMDEGALTRFRSHYTDSTYLANITDKYGLAKYLVMSKGDERSGVSDKQSVKEDLIESIIGAVYIDSGRDVSVVEALVKKLLQIDLDTIKNTLPYKDAKSELQEYCQKKGLSVPAYQMVSKSGPDHKPVFTVCCTIGDIRIESSGTSKQNAEKQVASLMLAKIKKK